ncbi:hypothetical protein SAMD00019534_043920 [Acytostelium subglobosum LB1]|uniref:hypothetical protein n=1 Tax=Acytostelium subglobosum LB1 TaxID=1410327 RepID=UPI0006447F2E|nr:hypothetical protein SAMD00019534_121560 [Acytostelium subglobosum LB1]XP_012755336.1 hypothetical protein SAMD00019534_043920 [Acytostelium subglobosum LB1]GAM21217.1 hypothetical protein SAMD00019534_043920 [Acytostelium subglobosum LB1]GAM28980.1 hypothetical protein SAMD00019534_121560 [Acytostelium subglobosum LB1]|eukprot:XP_012748165.1 hypothetical protein SAMD00019534_121560 [Acytostelium subglobosum LB1]
MFDMSTVSMLNRVGKDSLTMPPTTWFSKNTSESFSTLFVTNGTMAGAIPSYMNVSSMNLKDNPNLVGPLLESHCRLTFFDFRNTGIQNIPNCYFCYWSYTQQYFVGSQVQFPQNFNCSVSLSKTFYLIKDTSKSFLLLGTNLGFRTPTTNMSEVSASVKVANSQMSISAIERIGTSTIKFSDSNIPMTFSWATDWTKVQGVAGYLSNNSLIVVVNGTFHLPDFFAYNIVVGNHPCPVTQQKVDVLQCTITSFVVDPTVTMMANISTPYQSFIQSAYTQNFPIVTYASPFTTEGGTLQLKGFFGLGATVGQMTVNINGKDCQLHSGDDTHILTQVDGPLPVGFANLTVTVNGVQFKSSNILYIDPVTKEFNCGPRYECSKHGTCVDGECQCSNGYGGQICEFQLNPNVVIQPSNSSTNLGSSRSKLDFNLVEIQELDLSRNVVRSILTNKWNFTTSVNGSLTTYHYGMLPASSLEVAVTFEYSTEARSLTFGGLDVNLAPGALKMTVDINEWQFVNNLNSLRAVFANQMTNLTEFEEPQCEFDSTTTYDDPQSKSLSYIKVRFEDTVYFGRFLPVALADGRATRIINEVINTTGSRTSQLTYIGINLPQCRACRIDPDFSLLIDTQHVECPSAKTSWLLIAIIVPIGVVVLAVIVAVILCYRKKISYIYMAKFKKSSSVGSSKLRSVPSKHN